MRALLLAPLLAVLVSCPHDADLVPSAATHALECRYGLHDSGDLDEPLAEDAETAVEAWLESDTSPWAADLERERHDEYRELWLREHDGWEVYAVVVDHVGDEGWRVSSWAMCDPALFPEEDAEAAGLGMWRDTNGTVRSFGEVHTVLGDCEELVVEGRPHVVDGEVDVVPAQARDTGWGRDRGRLWLTPGAAYVVDAGGPVTRWVPGSCG